MARAAVPLGSFVAAAALLALAAAPAPAQTVDILGEGVATGISDDGTTVVGGTPTSPGAQSLDNFWRKDLTAWKFFTEAARWDGSIGSYTLTDLGFLGGDSLSIAHAISGDGSTIAGASGTGIRLKDGSGVTAEDDAQAFVISGGGSMTALGGLSATNNFTSGFAVNSDGSVVAGWSAVDDFVVVDDNGTPGDPGDDVNINIDGANWRKAVVWENPGTGSEAITELPGQGNPPFKSFPDFYFPLGSRAISADGSTTGNWQQGGAGTVAKRTTGIPGSESTQELGAMVGGRSWAYGISDDGFYVVGRSWANGGAGTSDERGMAYRWNPTLHAAGQGDGAIGSSGSPGFQGMGYVQPPPSGSVSDGDSQANAITPDGFVAVGKEQIDYFEVTEINLGGGFVITGFNKVAFPTAIIWDEVNGIRTLNDALVNEFGLTNYQLTFTPTTTDEGTEDVLTDIGDFFFAEATDIVHDATAGVLRIVGWGYDQLSSGTNSGLPTGPEKAFAIELPDGGLFRDDYNPADFTTNGTTDFSDFLTLQANFGGTGFLIDGDANGDGLVNFSDFLILQANFGTTKAGGTVDIPEAQWAALAAFAAANDPGAVPEPATAVLIFAGVGALCAGRRRRRAV